MRTIVLLHQPSPFFQSWKYRIGSTNSWVLMRSCQKLPLFDLMCSCLTQNSSCSIFPHCSSSVWMRCLSSVHPKDHLQSWSLVLLEVCVEWDLCWTHYHYELGSFYVERTNLITYLIQAFAGQVFLNRHIPDTTVKSQKVVPIILPVHIIFSSVRHVIVDDTLDGLHICRSGPLSASHWKQLWTSGLCKYGSLPNLCWTRMGP